MAKIYYRRIKAGIMTIDEVLPRWREAVQKMLDEDKANQEQEQAENAEA